MSPKELEESIIEAKSGKRDAMMKILEQFKPYAFKVSRQYYIRNCDVNDNVQLCYVALMNAVDKYRAGSNNFRSYAFRTIENALKHSARKSIKYKNELSLNAAMDPSEASNDEFINLLKTHDRVDEDILKEDSIKEIKTALAKLPVDEKDLVSAVYIAGLPLKHYGAKKGLSYGQAIRKRNAALEKLKSELIN